MGSWFCDRLPGGGGTPRKIGWGVRPASLNPYPIYDLTLKSKPSSDQTVNINVKAFC